jgi:3-phenylpropionate/cinnamic acid dioxygenase small subunit
MTGERGDRPGRGTGTEPGGGAALDELLLQHRVEQFLYLEARLADESDHQGWLDLFDDEVTYWVPRGRADYDPDLRLSYINDNRTRLETRVRQLQTGVRWAQTPPSVLRRAVTNVEVVDAADDAVAVGSNLFVREYATQGNEEVRTWAGRVSHVLRPVDGGFRIRAKTIELVDSERSLPTLAFLL